MEWHPTVLHTRGNRSISFPTRDSALDNITEQVFNQTSPTPAKTKNIARDVYKDTPQDDSNSYNQSCASTGVSNRVSNNLGTSSTSQAGPLCSTTLALRFPIKSNYAHY